MKENVRFAIKNFKNGIQPFDMYFLLQHLLDFCEPDILDSPGQLGH